MLSHSPATTVPVYVNIICCDQFADDSDSKSALGARNRIASCNGKDVLDISSWEAMTEPLFPGYDDSIDGSRSQTYFHRQSCGYQRSLLDFLILYDTLKFRFNDCTALT